VAAWSAPTTPLQQIMDGASSSVVVSVNSPLIGSQSKVPIDL
jgi:hypothetical protein